MGTILKPSWWIQMFASTLMTMLFIYLIKQVATKVNVPIVSEAIKEV